MTHTQGESLKLPQTTVLSYFATVSSPTRVRRIAHVGLRVVAIWHALWSVVAFCLVAYLVVEGIIHAVPLRLIAGGNCRIPAIVGTVSVAVGLGQWLLSTAAERGSTRACMFVSPTLIVTAISLFFAVYLAVLIGKEAVEDHRWSTTINTLVIVPALTIAFTFAICILLIKDLSEFLQWIANNPAAEKPPVRFLP